MASRLAVITFVDETGAPVYPGQGLPGGPVYPSQGLPWAPAHPGHALPPPGSIATLPVFPFDPTERPDNSLPGSGGRPDNSLPGGGTIDNSLPPVQIKPGAKFVVKWLACHGLILVPDNSLPDTAQPR